MKITLLLLGKTSLKPVAELMEVYANKIKHYTSFEVAVIDNSAIRSEQPEAVKEAEAKLILKKIQPSDSVVLLDENGKTFDSIGFSNQLQAWQNAGKKHIVFIVGGAFGFHETVYKRAEMKISLSLMTFSHQIIRPVFMEQLYRGFSILKNEPYHHR